MRKHVKACEVGGVDLGQVVCKEFKERLKSWSPTDVGFEGLPRTTLLTLILSINYIRRPSTNTNWDLV